VFSAFSAVNNPFLEGICALGGSALFAPLRSVLCHLLSRVSRALCNYFFKLDNCLASPYQGVGETMAQTLHVFSGTFGSEDKARQYSEQQWERPAPDDSWSEEAYAAWEARNPTWPLRRDLALGPLDPDFVETIFGAGKVDYLETLLATEADRMKLRAEIPEPSDTLVLISTLAFNGKSVRPSSTPRLRYHGEYLWRTRK
jgi:hypothetical protein